MAGVSAQADPGTDQLSTHPMSPLNWRPLQYDDLPAVHALMLAVAAADDDDRVDTLADMQEQFDDPWSDPAVDGRLGLTADGKLAAFARCFANPDPATEARVFLEGEVHPAWRGRGLEAAVLDWLEARGAEKLSNRPAGQPRSLRSGAAAHQAERLALLEARGYRPLRYFYRMRRDLREPLPAVAQPAGLTLRAYTPDLAEPLFQAHNEAFADHWGFEPMASAEWQQFFIRSDSFRPEFTQILFDGDQIAAYSFNRIHAADNARLGVNYAHIGSLGTRRPWRKRGLASFLLAESMRLFRAAGYTHVTLGVDAANPTGAVALYERLGFQTVRRFVQMEKPLA